MGAPDAPARRILIACGAGHSGADGMLLVLAHPEWEVAATSVVDGNPTLATVHGNPTLATVHAAGQVLTVAGRPHVPLYAGMAAPMARALDMAALVHGESGLEGPLLPSDAHYRASSTRSIGSQPDSHVRG
jgi:inosine-uridine nucleoside N-ribohydrolase